MTVKELTEQCPFEIVHLGNPDAVLTEPYCCDLLSIAMGNAPAGSAWCTVMSKYEHTGGCRSGGGFLCHFMQQCICW